MLLDPYTRFTEMPERVFGGGSRQFRVIDNWAKRPRGWLLGDVAGIAIDRDDNIFVFARTSRPVMVFDREGTYLRWWGDSYFSTPHGISVGPDGSVFCVDTGDHTIKRFTPDGVLLQVFGTKHVNAPRMSGQPFNKPTHAAVAPTGDIYISDGYGNSHIHVFSPDGEHKFSWGGEGSEPGQFRIPHSVTFDREGNVYVVDRLNNRIQVFDLEGHFVSQWLGLHQPDDLVFGPDGTAYVCELEHRMSIWSRDGTRIASWGDEGESMDAGEVLGPHGLALDSQGSMYVGDLSDSYRGVDRGSRAVQKFVRV